MMDPVAGEWGLLKGDGSSGCFLRVMDPVAGEWGLLKGDGSSGW